MSTKYLSGAHEQTTAGPEVASSSAASAGKRSLTQDLPIQRKAAASPSPAGATETAAATDAATDPFSLHLPVQRKVVQRSTEAAADAKPDPNEVELKTKVGALAASKFGGDYRKAFDHYDSDKDGAISRDELMSLLSDAGVGNGLTRGAWAKGVIGKMDKSGDGKIQWAEFEAATRG